MKVKNDINGWLNVYKPAGVGSTDVVNKLKWLLKPKKIGHAGTLDPFAEGVLPIAIGEATKLIRFAQEARKTYIFTLKFGEATDTYDNTGEIIEKSDKIPLKPEIQRVLEGFKGKIKQIPPKYSAVKINGKRAYDLAREGVEFEIKEREVEVYNLELLEQISEKEFKLLAKVSKGTYIRTLGVDIALSLGSVGHLTYLKRDCVGNFEANKAILFEKDKNDAIEYSSYLDEPEIILSDILVLRINEGQASDLKLGKFIENFAETDEEKIAVFNDKIIAILEPRGSQLKPSRVFNH